MVEYNVDWYRLIVLTPENRAHDKHGDYIEGLSGSGSNIPRNNLLERDSLGFFCPDQKTPSVYRKVFF